MLPRKFHYSPMLLRGNLGGFWSLLDSLTAEKSTFMPCSCVEIVDECFFNLFTMLADVQGKMSELQKEISQLIGGLHFDPYFNYSHLHLLAERENRLLFDLVL